MIIDMCTIVYRTCLIFSVAGWCQHKWTSPLCHFTLSLPLFGSRAAQIHTCSVILTLFVCFYSIFCWCHGNVWSLPLTIECDFETYRHTWIVARLISNWINCDYFWVTDWETECYKQKTSNNNNDDDDERGKAHWRRCWKSVLATK